MTQSLGRGKALPLLTPRRPVPDKIQLPTPTTTPKISLKLGKHAGHVKSTPKTAGVSEGKAMERDAKALYPVSRSLDIFLSRSADYGGRHLLLVLHHLFPCLALPA